MYTLYIRIDVRNIISYVIGCVYQVVGTFSLVPSTN